MKFFNERIDSSAIATLEHIIASPFEHLTYTEAIEILAKSGKAFEFPVEWGKDLQSEHERFLTEEHVKRPIVVTDYPKAIKAFYMYVNDDEQHRARDGRARAADRRDHRRLAARGPARTCSSAGSRECGLRAADYWWYLDLRRHGSVPHAGFGLGFERAVQFITGMQNIRDVIPFPRVPGYAEF